MKSFLRFMYEFLGAFVNGIKKDTYCIWEKSVLLCQNGSIWENGDFQYGCFLSIISTLIINIAEYYDVEVVLKLYVV